MSEISSHRSNAVGHWVSVGVFLVALTKIYLAANLELFQDEAFYWLESRHLALSYSDIPPLTALAIRAGTEVVGDHVLGVRAVFLLAGCITPFLLYWFARPFIGRKDAWLVAGCGLLIPLMMGIGPLAISDSLLVPIGIAFMGAVERATREGALRYWALCGFLIALGFLCHYRFAPLLLGAVCYLLGTRAGRSHLRGVGPWVAGAIGILGLLPVVWFNAMQHFEAMHYQFLGRHPWSFDFSGFRFVVRQFLVVTPLLFVFLLFAWSRLGKAAWHGHDRYCLVWWFASCAAGIYFLLSPVMGQHYVNYHWPLEGYLPLLVFLPGLFRSSRVWLSRLTLGFAGLASLALALMMGLQAHTDFLWQRAPALVFPGNTNFAGWSQMADRSRTIREVLGADLLIGDHYGVAAQLSFLGAKRVYTIDGSKAKSDGRALQLKLWSMDERALKTHRGASALAVFLGVERGKDRPLRRNETVTRLCKLFGQVDLADRQSLWGGAKVFEYYHAQGLGQGPAERCPVSLEAPQVVAQESQEG